MDWERLPWPIPRKHYDGGKLSHEQREEVKNRRAQGEKLSSIAEEFGISQTHVSVLSKKRNLSK